MNPLSSYGPKSENPAVGALNLESYGINLPQFFFGDSWECPAQGYFLVLFSDR